MKPEASIIIQNDRLKVDIAEPGTVYSRARFDWHGFITQITLDGTHTFCAYESLIPGYGTGGIGLCNEFGANEPLGYEETLPGQSFPKLGIGLLKRIDDSPYSSASRYEIEPFPREILAKSTSARFIVGPIPCNGYEARLEKTISLEDNTLLIDYKLENSGSKPIITTEYCHNFFCIDNKPIGIEYELKYPYSPIFDRNVEIISINNGKISWRSTPQKDFYGKISGFPKQTTQQWELVHVPSKVGIRCHDEVIPARAALWGAAHVVSPEVFAEINIKPGETKTWSRRYEFFAQK